MQTNDPNEYAADKSNLDELKVAGAEDTYVLWQNKRFEVVVVAANVPPGDGASGATKINSRIR